MNLPAAFERQMRQLLGDDYDNLRQALLDDPAVSIRLNTAKLTPPAPTTADDPVPWATEARYLEERPQFTFDPLLHAGCYYVQEASSMFVEQAVRQHLGGRARVALDLCAAPGGKSTLLRSLLPEECILVSNEVMRPRAQVLAENITKWGHPRCIVTSNYPADFTRLGGLFDLIVVDAPCSGEGMFRKDETAVAEWSPEGVEVCWRRQRDIITDTWPTLRPGGLLIYSTCTFNTEEDERNVRWMMDELEAELLPIATDEAWGIAPSFVEGVEHVYRFLPGRTRGEGFFLAALRKPADTALEEEATTQARHTKRKRDKGTPSTCALPWGERDEAWITHAEDYACRMVGTDIVALPKDMVATYDMLAERLHIVRAGIALAEQKGRDAIPSHELAMSTELSPTAFARCELSYADALRYLRREAIVLPTDVPRGFVIVTYREVPLGFVKNLGTRANNLYPNEWRIRSSHLPDEEVRVVV